MLNDMGVKGAWFKENIEKRLGDEVCTNFWNRVWVGQTSL